MNRSVFHQDDEYKVWVDFSKGGKCVIVKDEDLVTFYVHNWFAETGDGFEWNLLADRGCGRQELGAEPDQVWFDRQEMVARQDQHGKGRETFADGPKRVISIFFVYNSIFKNLVVILSEIVKQKCDFQT